MLIKLPPIPGKRAFTAKVDPYTLPEGLENDLPVTVLEVHEGEVTVQTEDGRIWKTGHWMIDAGYRYKIKGRMLREYEPEVIASLEEELAKSKARPSTNCDMPVCRIRLMAHPLPANQAMHGHDQLSPHS